jgi:nicotinamide riboside kinase
MKQHQLKKIVVIGPESTGKSTLCSQLAAHYGTLWVKEYAREYLLQHGMDYSFADLLTIAQGQIGLEEEAVKQMEKYGLRMTGDEVRSRNVELGTTNDEWDTASNSSFGADRHRSEGTASFHIPLFIDTDMQVMQVWCQFVFGKTHPWIEEQLAQRHYDLYLLCNTDLPWVKDELREYPDLASREKLFAMYKEMMENQSVPWAEIKGPSEGRLQQAIAAVDGLLG